MNIREKLSLIVTPKNAENWYKRDLFLENTLPALPKELNIVEMPPEEAKNYNCFLFVLGLHKNISILKKTNGFIYEPLIKKLLKEKKLRESKKVSEGDIIFYLNEDSITHAGFVLPNNKIISKWSWGPIIEHEIFDVPDFYGDEVRFYSPISQEDAIILFEKFEEFNKI